MTVRVVASRRWAAEMFGVLFVAAARPVRAAPAPLSEGPNVTPESYSYYYASLDRSRAPGAGPQLSVWDPRAAWSLQHEDATALTLGPAQLTSAQRHGASAAGLGAAAAAAAAPGPALEICIAGGVDTVTVESLVCTFEAEDFVVSNPMPVVELVDTSTDGRYYTDRDGPAWTRAFQNAGFATKPVSRRGMHTDYRSWSALLCLGLNHRNTACMPTRSFPRLVQHQRTAMISGVRSILWRKDAMCDTIRAIGTPPGQFSDKNGHFLYTMNCYVLPRDTASLSTDMERDASEGTGQRYMVKPLDRGEGHGLFVASTFEQVTQQTNEYMADSRRLVQPFMAEPFLIDGRKFDLRTYVFVTSISPLRVYLYDEGLVRFAAKKYSKNSTKEEEYLTNTSTGKKHAKLKNLTWAFRALRDWFDANGYSAAAVFERMKTAIVSLLMTAEFKFQAHFHKQLHGYACENCYQLLGVDVMFDSSLKPVVIEVNGLPSMQLTDKQGTQVDSNDPYARTKLSLTSDIIKLVYKPRTVAAKLAAQLEQLGIGVQPGPLCDPAAAKHTTCVDKKDLRVIARTAREFENRGAFSRIYPIGDCDRYGALAEHVHTKMMLSAGPTSHVRARKLRSGKFKTTYALHSVACRLAAMQEGGSGRGATGSVPPATRG